MQGTLFSFFGTTLPSYFTLLLTGFVFATVMGAIWAKRIGQDPDVIVDLGLAMLIAGVAGARILHVLVDGYFWDYVHLCTDPKQVTWQITQAQCRVAPHGPVWDAVNGVCHPTQSSLSSCFAWANFTAGGFTYYGGFIGASVAAWYLLKRDRFPFWKAADMAGLVIPVGLGFGRMGCLLAGCCFGKTWTSSLGLSFPGDSPASEFQYKAKLLSSPLERSLPVHPTQIYESVGSFAIAAALILFLHGRKRYDGQVFLAFVLLYSALRFVLEFWRSDDRGGLFGLSTSQLIGIALVGAVVVVHQRVLGRSRGPSAPAPAGS